MPLSLASSVSIALRPPSSLPAVTSWPTMRGSVSSPHFDLSAVSIPKPIMKPWSRSTPTVGCDTARSRNAILASLALSPIVALAHSPISLPASRLSVAKVASAAVIGVERRVERDHQKPRVARLLHRGHDAFGIGRGDQDALGAVGDAGLDRRDLALAVAVDLAGVAVQRHAEFFRLGLRAFLHLDEERVGVGLGDETGAHVRGEAGAGHRDEGQRRAGEKSFHGILPELVAQKGCDRGLGAEGPG